MVCLGHLWSSVWPVLTSLSMVGGPAFAWQHWRIKVVLSRHQVQVTAMLDRRLKVKVEVDDANAVKIIPLPPASAESAGHAENKQ